MSAGANVGNVRSIGLISFTLDPVSVAAQTSSEHAVSIPGLQLNDFLTVTKPSHTTGLFIGNARVIGTDSMGVQVANVTLAAIDAPPETYSLMVVRTDGERATHANF